MENSIVEKSMFEPDKTKEKYELNIKVFENCSFLTISRIDKSFNPGYYEIIGLLDTIKKSIIEKQSEVNKEHLKEEADKFNEEQKEILKKENLSNITSKHILYKNGDENIPEIIKDRFNDVVLAMCKICGKAESELSKECK